MIARHPRRRERLRPAGRAGAVALALLACGPMVNEVRVEPGAAPSSPAFVLTDTTGRGPSGVIYGLSVLPCGADSAVWTITALGNRNSPERIVYGQPPDGYASTTGPRPLRTGCYDVFVTDGRRARFRIDGAGQLVSTVPRDSIGSRMDTIRR
ncbi:MAG TPA: hypothetical protein VJU87_09390 [Gemmatimonadaceae bacterium]|nr:hypothetical protein [Gemmatimonadaceae bacterium]